MIKDLHVGCSIESIGLKVLPLEIVQTMVASELLHRGVIHTVVIVVVAKERSTPVLHGCAHSDNFS